MSAVSVSTVKKENCRKETKFPYNRFVVFLPRVRVFKVPTVKGFPNAIDL